MTLFTSLPSPPPPPPQLQKSPLLLPSQSPPPLNHLPSRVPVPSASQSLVTPSSCAGTSCATNALARSITAPSVENLSLIELSCSTSPRRSVSVCHARTCMRVLSCFAVTLKQSLRCCCCCHCCLFHLSLCLCWWTTLRLCVCVHYSTCIRDSAVAMHLNSPTQSRVVLRMCVYDKYISVHFCTVYYILRP